MHEITKITGIAALILGIIILIAIDRRKFYRRASTGNEFFPRYFAGKWIRLLELLSTLVAICLIGFGGIIILMMLFK